MVSLQALKNWEGMIWFFLVDKLGTNPYVQNGVSKTINFVANELILLQCLLEKLGIADTLVDKESVERVETYVLSAVAYGELKALFDEMWLGQNAEVTTPEKFELVFGSLMYSLQQEFGIQVPKQEDLAS